MLNKTQGNIKVKQNRSSNIVLHKNIPRTIYITPNYTIDYNEHDKSETNGYTYKRRIVPLYRLHTMKLKEHIAYTSSKA